MRISGNNQIFNGCQEGLIPFVLSSMAFDLNYIYFKGKCVIDSFSDNYGVAGAIRNKDD
jgi:hypothetical protein